MYCKTFNQESEFCRIGGFSHWLLEAQAAGFVQSMSCTGIIVKGRHKQKETLPHTHKQSWRIWLHTTHTRLEQLAAHQSLGFIHWFCKYCRYNPACEALETQIGYWKWLFPLSHLMIEDLKTWKFRGHSRTFNVLKTTKFSPSLKKKNLYFLEEHIEVSGV